MQVRYTLVDYVGALDTIAHRLASVSDYDLESALVTERHPFNAGFLSDDERSWVFQRREELRHQ